MNGIDLPVAAVLVDDGSVLRPRRLVIVGIGTKSDRCRQPVELLAKADIARQKIVRRRPHGVGGRTERADPFSQMRDLKIGQNGKIMGDVEPGVALEAGIGLIEARILPIDRLLRSEPEIDAVPVPKRMRAQWGLEYRGDVRTLVSVRRKDVAVIEAPGNQRWAEQPRSGANADRFVSRLLSIFHRRILG